MNLSATKQMSASANRQDAVRGDQDISVFGIDESTIEQSLRCSLQVSQPNLKLSAAAKQNINKLLFQGKQLNSLDHTKNEYKVNNLLGGAGNQKYTSLLASPIDYKNKYSLIENNRGEINSADLSVILHKNRDLQEEENLIKLVSEHLIQSIQYLQKRQNHQSTSYIESYPQQSPEFENNLEQKILSKQTNEKSKKKLQQIEFILNYSILIKAEGEDVPDENIAIHTIKSDIIGPNLLSQKNETTDMEKVKYFEQNFTQLWFQQYQKLSNLQQQQQAREKEINQDQEFSENSDSDTDQESPHLRQPVIFKRGSGSDTPILARNIGKRNPSTLEESKNVSQQISNSFSDDYSSDSIEENENSQELKYKDQIHISMDNLRSKGKQILKDYQLQADIETMKHYMHANGMINSTDLKKDRCKIITNQMESSQFNRSPKKFLTTSNVPINIIKSDSDSKPNQNGLRSSKKLNTTQGFKPMSNRLTSEYSPPFDLLQPVEPGNSLLIPPQMMEQPILSGSTMDETYDLQQQIQQMKQLNPFEDNRMNQKFSTLMQNSILTSQKKKSILSTQSHNQLSGKKNDQASHGVRFDQNVEFFDSNLDLLKKHQDQSMNQSLLPEGKGSFLSQPPNLRALSSNSSSKQNSPNSHLTQSIIEQRSSEIKNQQIIQEGWLLKKSTNKVLNTYQKRYFILTSEKLFFSKDMTFKKIKGCINIKYLTCYVSLNKAQQNPKKLHLKITEMKKLLKLKEILPGDITRWYKNLQQVISYYYNQEKVMMNNNDQSLKHNYKRDVITESDLESIAETGDLIIFNNDSDKSKSCQNLNHQTEMGMLIKFNNNDLRVFYLDKNNTICLSHWERFILDNDIFNSLIFRKMQMSERNQILPFIYESVRQHLNDNYKKKLKNTLSDSQEDSKQLQSIQKNSQLIASIFQKAGLIKNKTNINKFTTDSFCQKKGLKFQNNAKLSNEITVVLKRHIFFASDNSDIE